MLNIEEGKQFVGFECQARTVERILQRESGEPLGAEAQGGYEIRALVSGD